MTLDKLFKKAEMFVEKGHGDKRVMMFDEYSGEYVDLKNVVIAEYDDEEEVILLELDGY